MNTRTRCTCGHQMRWHRVVQVGTGTGWGGTKKAFIECTIVPCGCVWE